jgi:hypothetical protein
MNRQFKSNFNEARIILTKKSLSISFLLSGLGHWIE